MKYAVFSLLCLFLAGGLHAQTKSVSQQEVTKLSVFLGRNGMTVTYLDKHIPITNLQSLDSLVKKIPDPEHSRIEFESLNADKDQSIAIIRVLEKCTCHLTTVSSAVQE